MEKRIATLDELMDNITNYHSVKSELSSLDHDLLEFHNYSTRIKTLTENENLHEDELFVDTFDGKIFDFKTNALKWIRQYEESVHPNENASREGSRRSSRSSRSHRFGSSGRKSNSSGGSHRSVKDAFMQEAAKMAALQAEISFKSKMTELDAQRKIASQQARLDVYGHFLKSEENKSHLIDPSIVVTSSNLPLNPQVTTSSIPSSSLVQAMTSSIPSSSSTQSMTSSIPSSSSTQIMTSSFPSSSQLKL